MTLREGQGAGQLPGGEACDQGEEQRPAPRVERYCKRGLLVLPEQTLLQRAREPVKPEVGGYGQGRKEQRPAKGGRGGAPPPSPAAAFLAASAAPGASSSPESPKRRLPPRATAAAPQSPRP